MLKKILIAVTAVIVSGGILSATGCAHRHGYGTPEKKAEKMVSMMKNMLDLSDEQVTEVNIIKDEILAKHDVMKTLHEGFYETMIEQVRSDSFDEDKVNRLFDSKEAKFKEMKSFMISETAKLHAILTTEQREKIAEMMEEHYEDRNNR